MIAALLVVFGALSLVIEFGAVGAVAAAAMFAVLLLATMGARHK